LGAALTHVNRRTNGRKDYQHDNISVQRNGLKAT